MAWTIRLLEEQRVAEIRYSGLVTYRERCQVKAALMQELDRTGIRRILVDYTGAQAATEDVAELRAFLDDMANAQVFRGARAGYVNAPFEHETATRAMARIVGYEFGSFRDRSVALDWLLADAD